MAMNDSIRGNLSFFMTGLPFSEKKRIVEAIIAPEKGGKCEVRYLLPADILDDNELASMPTEQKYSPILDRPAQVSADFKLDLDKVETVIFSLNRNKLLNKLNEDGRSLTDINRGNS